MTNSVQRCVGVIFLRQRGILREVGPGVLAVLDASRIAVVQVPPSRLRPSRAEQQAVPVMTDDVEQDSEIV